MFSKALISDVRLSKDNADHERIILNVGNDAGIELHEQLKTSRGEYRKAEFFRKSTRRIDSDDWFRFRKEAESEQIPIRYLIRTYMPEFMDSDAAREIQSVMIESASFEDFQRAVANLETRAKEKAEAVQEKKLTFKVGTFAGEESTIPAYVI